MANLRETLKDHSDIGPPKGYFKLMGIIMAVAVGIALLLTAISAFAAWSDNKTVIPQKNAKIEAFNALPQESREAIIKWEHIADYDPETYLRPLLEERRVSVWIIDYADSFIMGIVLGFSVITFLLYFLCVFRSFYLCDVPRTWYGRLLFWLMFVGWPFLAISWVRMHIKEGENLRARRERWKAEAQTRAIAMEHDETLVEEQEQGKAAEPIASEEEPDADEQTDDAVAVRPVVDAQSEDEAKANYLAAVMADRAKKRQLNIVSAQSRVRATEEDLNRLNDELQTAMSRVNNLQMALRSEQKRLGERRAEVQKFEEVPPPDMTVLQRQVDAEWEIMRQMQGVYYVGHEVCDDQGEPVEDPNSEDACTNLVVRIRVCIPYDEEIYDMGDYEFCLAYDGYSCKRLRAGLRDDTQDCEADYYDGLSHDFCFGDRTTEIRAYLGEGHFVEALTLIIDGLHYVNVADQDLIPECFRAIDTTSDPVIDQYYIMGGN